MRHPVDPAGLVRDVRAGGKSRGDLVAVLLVGEHPLDLGTGVGGGEPSGGDRAEHPGQVGGGDQVVEAGAAGRGVLDAAGQARAGGAAGVAQHRRHLGGADVLEQQVGREVARLHGRVPGQGPQGHRGAEPGPRSRRPGRRAGRARTATRRSADRKSLWTGTAASRSSVPSLVHPVGGHEERQLHRAGRVVRLLRVALVRRRPVRLTEPDRDGRGRREVRGGPVDEVVQTCRAGGKRGWRRHRLSAAAAGRRRRARRPRPGRRPVR